LQSLARGFIDLGRSYLRIAGLVPSGGRGLVGVLVASNLVLGGLPVVFVVATSMMIGHVPAAVGDGVGSAAWWDLVATFVVAAVAFLAGQILAPVQTSLGELLARRVDGRVYRRLIRAALRARGNEALEDQRVLGHLAEVATTLEQAIRTPGQACAGLIALIARYTQLVGSAAVVAIVFAWPAGVALIVATMGFRKAQRGGQREASKAFVGYHSGRRTARYYRMVSTRAAAAKEIRVFGIAGWLAERYREIQMAGLALLWVQRRRIFLKPYLAWSVFGFLVTGVVMALAGSAASSDAITLTQMTLCFQASLAALRLGEFFPESDLQTQYGMIAYEGVEGFEKEMALAARGSVQLEPAIDPAGRPRDEVRFEAVRFSYPGAERRVLDGLDLTLPAGLCTAIVGLNGAGKTTIIKLLARLHEPGAGRIMVDGDDIRSYPVRDWRRRIGVIFQDFVRYELTAAENIGLGAVELAGDRALVRSAAERAGVLATLERLPLGLDTPLARQYDNGAELSGGQWQRLAIARALFALEGGASILVLDEPTAALDVRAEAAFFERFIDVTRGATTLLISHRFSSVRHADNIVVLAGGRVAEQGSHADLLAAGGRYAELFKLQADRFAEADEAEDSAEPQEAPR
jgi:ATP-binding cassette subfamily B protein